jgi:hypothetical protein
MVREPGQALLVTNSHLSSSGGSSLLFQFKTWRKIRRARSRRDLVMTEEMPLSWTVPRLLEQCSSRTFTNNPVARMLAFSTSRSLTCKPNAKAKSLKNRVLAGPINWRYSTIDECCTKTHAGVDRGIPGLEAAIGPVDLPPLPRDGFTLFNHRAATPDPVAEIKQWHSLERCTRGVLD